MLFTCQAGFEDLLGAELSRAGCDLIAESGPGWLRVETGRNPEDDWCFAHRVVPAPTEIRGEGVNALAAQVVDWFAAALRDERIDAAWPCFWQAPIEVPGLAKRLGGVEAEFHRLFRKRLSRVAKLAAPDLPRGTGTARGLFVFAADFGRLYVGREAWLGGQRRMADDAQAPSRSYLKTEEAFVVLGRCPAEGETVADLGAAPGGWSYSAAKRGARVVAVDNGPLKGGALNHPLIEHRMEDAFRFRPPAGSGFDWLFCDMVEDPSRVLDLVAQWTRQRWCRRIVVNLKFGRANVGALLDAVRRGSGSPLRQCAHAHVRHLFHDREEITIVGELA